MRSLLIRCSGFAVALFVFTAVRALGDDVTPAPSAAATFAPPTRDQFGQLLNALAYELKPNSGKVLVHLMDASKLPAFDPIAHYIGMPDGKTPTVEAAAGPKATDADIQKAIRRAFLLAVMDDGEAGPYWKDLYDRAAAKDATLPSTAPDPYRYRDEIVDAVEATIATIKANGSTP